MCRTAILAEKPRRVGYRTYAEIQANNEDNYVLVIQSGGVRMGGTDCVKHYQKTEL